MLASSMIAAAIARPGARAVPAAACLTGPARHGMVIPGPAGRRSACTPLLPPVCCAGKPQQRKPALRLRLGVAR